MVVTPVERRQYSRERMAVRQRRDVTPRTLAQAVASEKRPRRRVGPLDGEDAIAAGQFTRVQVWPPQNMPPKAQPWTRRVSVPFIAIVES